MKISAIWSKLSYVVYIVASIISQHDDYIKYSNERNTTTLIVALLSISSNFVIIVKFMKNLSTNSVLSSKTRTFDSISTY